MKVSDLAEALMRDYAINRRKSLRTVKSRWQTHLKPFFEEIPAETINTDQVEGYIALRLEEKAEPSTINRELAALKRMYALAIRSRKLSLSECPYIPHLAEKNVRKGFLRDAQYQALATSTAAIGLWLRAAFECGCTYGCRKSELLNLKVRQVILEERAIILEAGETKNDEARFLPMTDKVLELITECVAGKLPDDYVFTRTLDRRGHKSRVGGRVADMRGAWAEATKTAACPELLFHDLRRSGVRTMIRSGIGTKVAMRISGHKTESVFQRYNIIDRADLDDAVRKLEVARRLRRQMDLFESGDLFPPSTPAKGIKPN